MKFVYWAITFQLGRRLQERRGAREIWASRLFDVDYYLKSSPTVADSSMDPVTHYLRHGAEEGLDPSPFFDTRYYLEENVDVAQRGQNPLLHFIRSGAAEGRNPNPRFDTAHYLRSNPFVAEHGLNPLRHYIEVGMAAGSLPQPPEPLVSPTSDTAVILHLYYPDLWGEIRGYLQNLGGHFDLYVSLCDETAPNFRREILRDFPSARVRTVANYGRDIGPFLELVRDDAMSQYKYVCKIHSKRSPHRIDGDAWRGRLLDQLLGSPETVRRIKRTFDAEETLGMIGPGLDLDRSHESWGSNQQRMTELMAEMGLSDAPSELEFFAGSMFWFRPPALEPLMRLGIAQHGFENEGGQLDGTLAHAIERLFGTVVKGTGYRLASTSTPPSDFAPAAAADSDRFKAIAFYLPQFHPIAENDAWWGPGFTEWTNAAKARPLYRGHQQPRLPRDLGFYDLRLAETRAQQARLAAQYGIYGFCYYYYWFDGKRLLDRPLAEVLASGEPDFPFCICWANENWTRRWDGMDDDVLVHQTYSLESNRRFIDDVLPILRDRRYIRFEGKPVLLIYRPKEIPDLAETLAMWRERCREAGIGEIHLCAVRFWDCPHVHHYGFDAAIDFPPHNLDVNDVTKGMPELDPTFSGLIYDYAEAVTQNLTSGRPPAEPRTHRGTMLAWDNTARQGPAANIAHGACPKEYQRWLEGILQQELEIPGRRESLVFINAWNEWGEGATLEPDNHHGLGFLEATREALSRFQRSGAKTDRADDGSNG